MNLQQLRLVRGMKRWFGECGVIKSVSNVMWQCQLYICVYISVGRMQKLLKSVPKLNRNRRRIRPVWGKNKWRWILWNVHWSRRFDSTPIIPTLDIRWVEKPDRDSVYSWYSLYSTNSTDGVKQLAAYTQTHRDHISTHTHKHDFTRCLFQIRDLFTLLLGVVTCYMRFLITSYIFSI